MDKNWIFLSHKVSDELSAYGNGDRVQLEFDKQIDHGDACNNSKVGMSLHFGTHIDFPYHFSASGKKSSDYPADYFISDNIAVIEKEDFEIQDSIIQLTDDLLAKVPQKTEILFVKTNFYQNRLDDSYWSQNPTFKKGAAKKLKTYFPNLRFVGFDSISLNPWQNRPYGREVHKEFLVEEGILVIEDVNFNELEKNKIIKEVIISPLVFQGADAAPATILASI